MPTTSSFNSVTSSKILATFKPDNTDGSIYFVTGSARIIGNAGRNMLALSYVTSYTSDQIKYGSSCHCEKDIAYNLSVSGILRPYGNTIYLLGYSDDKITWSDVHFTIAEFKIK